MTDNTNDHTDDRADKRHLKEDSIQEDMKRIGAVLDDLCLHCRMRMLAYILAYYVDQVREDQQAAYTNELLMMFKSLILKFNDMEREADNANVGETMH